MNKNRNKRNASDFYLALLPTLTTGPAASIHPAPPSLLVVPTLETWQKHQVPGQQSQLLPPLHSIWNPTPTVRRWDGNEALLGPSKYCSCFLYSHLGFMECGSGSAYKST